MEKASQQQRFDRFKSKLVNMRQKEFAEFMENPDPVLKEAGLVLTASEKTRYLGAIKQFSTNAKVLLDRIHLSAADNGCC